ncbi:MAG: DUF2263 domain-containing protein, partial [Proteobacteria bacterium]|nr:DUF2263 domain-containing protein [Pseudomonadota bacterium]
QFSVVYEDTFTAAEEGARCLNFASHKRPGGGYKEVMDIKGTIRTQEEDLFRRSAVSEHRLHRFRVDGDRRGQRCQGEAGRGKCLPHPLRARLRQDDPALGLDHRDLPDRDRGDQNRTGRRRAFDGGQGVGPEHGIAVHQPDPYMGVEEQRPRRVRHPLPR